MNTVVIWTHRDVAVELSVEAESLISRVTEDSGQTWSKGKVEATEVRVFSAKYIPSQHRIAVVVGYDFRTDVELRIYYVTQPGGGLRRRYSDDPGRTYFG